MANWDPAVAQELKVQVALACRVLYHLGLADYLGHPSARIPGTDYVVIKPRHSPAIRGMSEMTAKHMVVVDLECNLVEGDFHPPSETRLHTEIYRARPDVQAIVHTHQTMATAFGIVGRPLLPLIHNESELVEQPIPIYPSAALITTKDRGERVASSLGNHRIVLLRGHGVTVTAADVKNATVDTIHLERLANINYITAQLGTPVPLTPEDIALVKEEKQPIDGRWAYYTSLVDQDV